MTWAVLLTGDHPGLARAELEAHVGPATWLGPRIGLVSGAPEAIGRLAMMREAGAFLAAVGHDKLAAVQPTLGILPAGTKAVRAVRVDDTDLRRREVEQRLGAMLDGPIDLRAPEHTLAAWLTADHVVLSRRRITASDDYASRAVQARAHFSPVSLHPRTALALVHLTGCGPGHHIYDPFCGTGGILLEAALQGYRVSGSDRDPWMVQGTLGTLTDVGPQPLDGDIFEADIGDTPDLIGPVDGIVTDLPYGIASRTNREALAGLYERAFAAFAALLRPGGRAVIGHKDADLLAPVTGHGFEIEQVHEQFVHRSMTRRFAVVKRLP